MDNTIKYAYFDLDGTITKKDWTISNKTVEAIKYLKDKGIKIGIATGRSPYLTQNAISLLEPDLPTICLNGAMLINNDLNRMDTNYIDSIEFSNLVHKLYENKIDFIVYTLDGVYSSSANNIFFEKIRNDIKTNEYKKIFRVEVVDDEYKMRRLMAIKILVKAHSSLHLDYIVSNILNEFKNIDYIISQDESVDIMPPNISKGRALNWVFKASSYDLNDLIVFGDNCNDISMFYLTNNSVVLKDGNQEAMQYAQYITEKTCEEDGVADFIFKYL